MTPLVAVLLLTDIYKPYISTWHY